MSKRFFLLTTLALLLAGCASSRVPDDIEMVMEPGSRIRATNGPGAAVISQ